MTPITMIDYTRPLELRAAARKSVGPYSWTPVDRRWAHWRNLPPTGRGFYQSSEGLWMDERGSTFELRLEFAGACYTSEQDQRFDAIIARLPNGRGFLAGWTMGAGMAAALDGRIWDTERDAERAAIDMTQDAAESDVSEPEPAEPAEPSSRDGDVTVIDSYLERFPPDQRATAERAYQDGFSDGVNVGKDFPE